MRAALLVALAGCLAVQCGAIAMFGSGTMRIGNSAGVLIPRAGAVPLNAECQITGIGADTSPSSWALQLEPCGWTACDNTLSVYSPSLPPCDYVATDSACLLPAPSVREDAGPPHSYVASFQYRRGAASRSRLPYAVSSNSTFWYLSCYYVGEDRPQRFAGASFTTTSA
eukprot:scaffold4.g4879.t1